jgi:hypothetical protein
MAKIIGGGVYRAESGIKSYFDQFLVAIYKSNSV